MLEQLEISFLYESDFKHIEAYEDDLFAKNVFYGITNSNEKIFMIEVEKNKITDSIVENLKEMIKNPHKNMFKLLYVLNKKEDTICLCYEFTDISLIKYIRNANPSLNTRLLLMRQAIDYIIHFHNHKIKLDEIDMNYIFIEHLDDPVLKILNFSKIKLINK
jgi:hypothetical protein